jgi:hypothetical protein
MKLEVKSGSAAGASGWRMCHTQWRFECPWTKDAAAAAPKYIVLGVADVCKPEIKEEGN